ncbi:MAG: hypothetical protein ACXWYG_03220 [Aeromicrobium sp.]
MAATSPHATLGRKLLATGAALAITSGVVGGAMLMGSGASADDSSAETRSSVSADAGADGSSADSDVARFRADMQDARALTGEARTDAIKKIHQDAEAGKYGDKVQQRAERREHRRAAMWAHAPAGLKADLKEVRDAVPADRAALKHEIFTKALDGDYGDRAQKRAERLKNLVDGE